MSRHKLVKNLDLDDELDDFDGDDFEEAEAEGMSPLPHLPTIHLPDLTPPSEFSEEDKQLLQAGSVAVRAELPPDITSQISDKQITDALWHYYYDVEKSVSYLVGTVKKESVKKEPKVQGAFHLISVFG